MSSPPLVVLIMVSMAAVFQADVALSAERLLVVGGDNDQGWGSGTKRSLNHWRRRIGTFKVNDILVFNYQDKSKHGVCQVGRARFDGCNPPLSENCLNSGSDHIQLKQKGLQYFICSHPNTCKNGMKIAINVV